jgi:hypothetical protein
VLAQETPCTSPQSRMQHRQQGTITPSAALRIPYAGKYLQTQFAAPWTAHPISRFQGIFCMLPFRAQGFLGVLRGVPGPLASGRGRKILCVPHCRPRSGKRSLGALSQGCVALFCHANGFFWESSCPHVGAGRFESKWKLDLLSTATAAAACIKAGNLLERMLL